VGCFIVLGAYYSSLSIKPKELKRVKGILSYLKIQSVHYIYMLDNHDVRDLRCNITKVFAFLNFFYFFICFKLIFFYVFIFFLCADIKNNFLKKSYFDVFSSKKFFKK
jgi:hypothetical protein